MQSLSKCNKGINYLLCAVDFFSKYAFVVPLKNKRGISIANVFQKIVSKGRKPNKIWTDQGGEFYNNLFKRFLKIKNIEIFSTNNEGKSVFAERFFRTLKNKIVKHMTAVSKNDYFDVLDNIVDKYNNTIHRSIKLNVIISKGRKPNKISVDWGGEFNNNLFKRFLKINNIEIYSTDNEEKSVVAERFIRTFKNKIFKHMTAILKNDILMC